MQDKLIKMNPELANYLKYNPTQNLDVASSNPDGDVEIRFDFNQFRYPVCSKCQETLKPRLIIDRSVF